MSEQLPVLTAKTVLRALSRAGFLVHHTSGSHQILKHPSHPTLRVTVPMHRGDLKRKTLRSIIEQAGYTVESFLRLL